MVKVGIIGLGFMGVTHLRAYMENPRVKLVAVADQVKARLEGDLSGVQGNIKGPGEKFDFSGLNTYETVEGLLGDPAVELVSICLPTPAHREVVEKALASGKHVLCEKPMALTVEDVDTMVETARASSSRLMIAQCIRFWPDYRKAREIVESGELGKVLSARFERMSCQPTWGGWLMDEKASGGMIVDLSIHDIDFAHHLLGAPDTVRAHGACDIPAGYDYSNVTMIHGGVPVKIEGGWLFPGEYPFSMAFDILCEKGILSFHSAQDRRLTVFKADGGNYRPDLRPGDGYAGEIDYLIDCIEKDEDPALSPPHESAISVKLALLAKESRERGGEELTVPAEWRG